MVVQSDESFDVFLSHAHTEAEAVEAIGEKLEDELGCKVWLDRWILVPGQHWQQEMAKGLDRAKTCAVCIGRNTPSGWFREEIQRALNRQTQNQSFRVIPVILPNGDRALVDEFLELRSWVEFCDGPDDEEALHMLTCGIRGVRPGRRKRKRTKQIEQVVSVKAKLSTIRDLQLEQLIDEEIAREYQRRLLDDLMKAER